MSTDPGCTLQASDGTEQGAWDPTVITTRAHCAHTGCRRSAVVASTPRPVLCPMAGGKPGQASLWLGSLSSDAAQPQLRTTVQSELLTAPEPSQGLVFQLNGRD